MSLFSAMDISATGLASQRLRMNVIAENLANVNTTRTSAVGPYRRKEVIFAARKPPLSFRDMLASPEGVGVIGIVEDFAAPKMVYNPQHPDANNEGYVAMPNIDIVTEMVNMIDAARVYEANTTAISVTKSMIQKALEIVA